MPAPCPHHLPRARPDGMTVQTFGRLGTTDADWFISSSLNRSSKLGPPEELLKHMNARAHLQPTKLESPGEAQAANDLRATQALLMCAQGLKLGRAVK